METQMSEEKQDLHWEIERLPNDPTLLKKLIMHVLEEEARDAQLQEEALMAMKALIVSWRWRLGNGVMSLAEKVLRRKPVRLAADQVLDLLNRLVDAHKRRNPLELARFASLEGLGIQLYSGPAAKERYTEDARQALKRFLESDSRLAFATGDSPRVSILLVLYNRAELTLACLRSILANVKLPVELILVDNASSDETPRLLERVDGATVLRNRENLGFLRACNQGAAEAKGEQLLFLNNDAVLLPNAVERAYSLLQEEPKAGAVGGRILLLDGSLQEAGSIVWQDGSCLGYGRGDEPSLPQYMFRRDVDYCSGAFLMTPLAQFRDLGGFDEVYAPAYYEETDYCLRLHETGQEVLYDPGIMILHYEFGSSEAASATSLQRRNRETFVVRHRDYLAARPRPGRGNILAARFVNGSKKKVLYIDDRVPHRSLGSGFPRSNFILNTLVELGYQVTMYPLNFPTEDSWDSVHSDISPRIEVMLGLGRQELEQHLKERRGYYDTIFVSRPHNMDFFSQVAAGIWLSGDRPKVVYDAEAIFALRDAAKHELFTGAEKRKLEKAVRAEVDLVKGADLVIAVSPGERETFTRYYHGEVHVVGHALSVEPSDTPFEARSGFLFVGNMDYNGSPNVDSMVWFIEEVFPSIRETLSGARLMLVGANAAPEIRQLADRDGVELLGRQEQLDEFYRNARVFVAPTRFAGGIPYKIHEAAALGVPVVASQLLVDQLDWRAGRDILSADIHNPEDFARRCIELYTDAGQWQMIRENALERIREECSVDVLKSHVREVFGRA